MFRNVIIACAAKLALCFSVFAGTIGVASAQHTITATYVTQPTGPNTDFSVNLTMSPSDVDIVGFDIAVGYNSSHGTLLSVSDNTGQPQAAADYNMTAETPLAGVAYANVYKGVILSTVSNLLQPVNIGQLNFRTSATYNDPAGNFYVYLTGRSLSSGPGDQYGGLVADIDGNWMYISTAYNSLDPSSSSVGEWMFY